MADVPDFQSMMLPILRRASEGEFNNRSAVERIASEFHLSEEDIAKLLPSGVQTTVSNRVAWAVGYMTRAGLLERVRRGVYVITDRGREILASNPKRIDIALLRAFPEFRTFISGRTTSDDGEAEPAAEEHSGSTSTPVERLEEAYRALTATLRVELLDRILSSSPTFFEKMVVKLLTEMGYGGTIEEASEHIGGPRDGGVDGVIRLDALGIDKVYIQAKRYSHDNRVGRPDVQSFSGALDDKQTTRGVFITTSSFSSDALSYVKSIPKQIVLIDGQRLAELLVRYGVGVRVDRRLEIKRLDEDFFEDP